MKALGVDYLDLYLIHWPCVARVSENWREINADTWRGFEKLYRDGNAHNDKRKFAELRAARAGKQLLHSGAEQLYAEHSDDHRYKQSAEILYTRVPVRMLFIRGLAGHGISDQHKHG